MKVGPTARHLTIVCPNSERNVDSLPCHGGGAAAKGYPFAFTAP